MPSIYEEVHSNSLLTLSLHGVRSVLEAELGVSPIIIATDETVKSEYMRREHTTFPYAHLQINEIMGVRDQSSNRIMQRQGFYAGLNGATSATTRKGYMFPVTVGMSLKYEHGDPYAYIPLAETLSILSVVGGLTFAVTLNGDFAFHVRIEIAEQTAISLASTTSAETPGGTEIEASLIIHTFAGFFRDVAAVNSDRPTVSMEISLKHGESDE